MKYQYLKLALLLCIICNSTYAQPQVEKKRGMLAFSAQLSDYGFFKTATGSSFKAFQQKGFFRPGNNSFGISVGYWKGLNAHIDFSGNLGGTFSNFPTHFVKDDSIGKAGFSSQLDGLLHLRALKEKARINPFMTGGIGAGYFGGQLAVYTPVGLGLQFRFNEGGFMFLQTQMRMALTAGISNDYMLYSIGFAQHGKLGSKEKKEKTQRNLPAKEKAKKQKAAADADSDADGISDSKDNCPTEKGTVNGCPDSDGDGIADKEDQCKDIAGVLRYGGCPIPDTDADGINDENDKCKTEKGDKDNYGCPWPDTDGDSVADKDDRCPELKGTAQNSGCPLPVAEGAELIYASADSMTYSINFDYDRAILLPDAFMVLKNIVEILKADRTLHINITGHADNGGTDAGNMQVSADRAKIAKDYFLSYNITANRIRSSFYGASRPIDNEQQWRNRRVEITIIKK